MSLENVQPGDTLIVHGRNSRRIATVDRLAKTQIVMGSQKFRKTNGGRIGDGDIWSRTHIEVPKPGECVEIRLKQHQGRLVNQVDDACKINLLREMSVEKLERLKEILEMP